MDIKDVKDGDCVIVSKYDKNGSPDKWKKIDRTVHINSKSNGNLYFNLEKKGDKWVYENGSIFGVDNKTNNIRKYDEFCPSQDPLAGEFIGPDGTPIPLPTGGYRKSRKSRRKARKSRKNKKTRSK